MSDVKVTLGQLRKLQEVESHLAAIDLEIRAVPQQIAVIEQTLSGAQKALAEAKERLQVCNRKRRDKEAEVEALKAKISKYQGQLLEVKTNEQYRALNNEIEAERREISRREDSILMLMEEADDLTKGVSAEDSRLQGEVGRVEGEKNQLQQQAKRLEKEKAELLADRTELLPKIDADGLSLFRRIGELRAKALSPVVGGLCGACRVRARPQALEEARQFLSLVQCEYCSRIFDPPPPGSAPAAAEADTTGD